MRALPDGRPAASRNLRLSFAASVLLWMSLPLFSQTGKASPAKMPQTDSTTAQLLASYEGQNVTSIEIAGQPNLVTAQFNALFVQKAGQPFSRQKVDQTIAAIKKAGKFDDVQLQVSPEAQGVRVLLVLEPATYFGIFEFPGAGQFAYSRLVQVSNFPPEAPFNHSDIERDRQDLITFFRQEGFFQAQVNPQEQVDHEHGIANIFFHVVLNPRAKFGAIDIAGTTPEEAAAMQKSLRSLMARFTGSAIRPGKSYRRKTITNARRRLQSRLEKKERLAAKVTLQGAEYQAASNRASIHFDLDSGPLVHVRIQGAHLWSWQRKSLLPVYQGAGVDQELVLEGQQALSSYFQGKGYFDAKVQTQFHQQNGVDTIVYSVDKQKKHKVSSVQLTGNRRLKTQDLVPVLTVKKAQWFSSGKYSDALLRASAQNLQAVYKADGFSSVSVSPSVTQKKGNIDVLFRIDEGPQDIVSALHIEGAATFPEAQFAPGGLRLGPGKPYSQKLVAADRANIMANYLKAGYLNASFRETASLASKNNPHRIDVVYHITEGPRVYTSQVITLGRKHTQQRLIDDDVATIKPEQPLSQTQLLTAESKLYDHSGVFEWAEVDPKSQITTQTQEDVLVKVHEGPRNQITYGFGFEVIERGGSVPSGTVALPNLPPIGLPSTFTTSQKTFYGPRGTFEYTRNNVRGEGESLSLTAFAGRLDQRGAAYYIDPHFRWSNWRTTASISVESNEENPIFSSQIELGSYQFQRYVGDGKANIFFLRYAFSETNLSRIQIPALVSQADRHVRLSTAAANFTRDTRDNPLNSTKGVLDTIEFDINPTALGSNVNFALMTAQSAYYKKIAGNTVWANSIRIGMAQPFAGSHVPLSEEFFTGGGNTLRGFPLDGAGPQKKIPVCSSGSSTDCTFIQIPTGGNEMLILNSEFRIPLPFKKGLGFDVFYDGGSVFPRVGFHDFTSLYSNNVGVGLTYSTPVGPIRVDLGRNLNPIPGVQPTQYFITIGQAF